MPKVPLNHSIAHIHGASMPPPHPPLSLTTTGAELPQPINIVPPPNPLALPTQVQSFPNPINIVHDASCSSLPTLELPLATTTSQLTVTPFSPRRSSFFTR